MFAMFDCACIEHAYRHLGAHTEEQATKDRIELLQKGGKFAKKALLGLTSQELFIRLSDDTTAIEWKTVGKASWTGGDEHGSIDLTTKVQTVKCSGTQGLSFIGFGTENEKSLFECQAENPAVRDQWLIAINELLQSWIQNPTKKPNYEDSASKNSDKASYFKKREEELNERIKANEEKKKKYSSGGMQHVAMAMMNRS